MSFLTALPDDKKRTLVRFAIFFSVLLATYSVLFVVPQAVDLLLLDPAEFFSGEFWRLFTYQFVHNSLGHLVENMIALLLSILLALELKSILSEYSVTYFAAGALAILPVWFFYPFIALGASTAIYGVFGFLSREATRFRMRPYSLLLVVAVISLFSAGYTYLSSGASLDNMAKQLTAHLAGLFFGYYFSLLVVKVRERYAARRYACLRSIS
jgi:rhomboid protease GluP